MMFEWILIKIQSHFWIANCIIKLKIVSLSDNWNKESEAYIGPYEPIQFSY